ncbi:DUF6262 family protein [Clostridium perfringens]|uniref:DUF6262 family protein n=1 Tax=Clostridium perfringens TaxID=1502 RepID=UPI001F584656|nr:DUF6262 family protein [Clostridium perfringens]MCI2779051.1 DUF6262 family protein [Clostridium perfringens]MDK0697484.1 DUF6262 family protein [Clostridium perfringens]
MGNKSPNTAEIIRLKKQESEVKKQAVLSVLKELELLDDPLNNPISKAEICRRAGVSKTFLYTYKDELLEPINKAINKQNKKVKVISQKQTFTETSKDRVIESLKRRIQSLEEENKKLKNNNAILLGKLAQR